MKGKLIYIYIFLFASCYQLGYGNDLKIRINKIRKTLLIGHGLPASIVNLDSLTFPKPDSIHHDFEYLIIRTTGGHTDSVRIHLMIQTNDTLMHLHFDEDYLNSGKEEKSFHYSVNKYGVIDYAYREEPLEGSKVQTQAILKGDDKVLIPTNQKTVFEINSNSHNSALKNPDKKILEMYNARLEKSVDELYNLLFK